MWDECKGCASIEECSTAVSPGSIMCISNRMNNKQTKGQQLRLAGEYKPILREDHSEIMEGEPYYGRLEKS
jgi:hypothetical protein